MLINSCLGFGENEDIDYDLAGSMNGAGAVVGFHNSVGIFGITNYHQKIFILNHTEHCVWKV